MRDPNPLTDVQPTTFAGGDVPLGMRHREVVTEAAERLLDDEAERRTPSARGRARVQASHGVDEVVARLRATYAAAGAQAD